MTTENIKDKEVVDKLQPILNFLRDTHELESEDFLQMILQLVHLCSCRYETPKLVFEEVVMQLRSFVDDEPNFSRSTEKIQEFLLKIGVLEEVE